MSRHYCIICGVKRYADKMYRIPLPNNNHAETFICIKGHEKETQKFLIGTKIFAKNLFNECSKLLEVPLFTGRE